LSTYAFAPTVFGSPVILYYVHFILSSVIFKKECASFERSEFLCKMGFHRNFLLYKKAPGFLLEPSLAIYNLINQLFCKFHWVDLNAWSHCRAKYYALKELTFNCCWSSFVDCIDKSLEVVCDLFISK